MKIAVNARPLAVEPKVSISNDIDTEMVRVVDLVFIPRLLMRERLDESHIETNLLPRLVDDPSAELDPIDVTILPDGQYVVTDGFHRGETYRRAGRLHIPARVTRGAMKDAVDRALANNPKHGLLLTERDKKVKFGVFWEEYATLVRDGKISNHEIARRTNLTVKQVGAWVNEKMTQQGENAPVVKMVKRGNTEYAMQVKSIGRKKKERTAYVIKLAGNLALQLRSIAQQMGDPYSELRQSLLQQIEEEA